MKIYKIRNDKGLFSKGGLDPTFNKIGKLWLRQYLKAHLTMLKAHSNIHLYDNCVIVEYDMTEVDTFNPRSF